MLVRSVGSLVLCTMLGLTLGAGDVTGQRRGGFGGGRGGGFDREAMQEMRTKTEAIRACPVDMMWTTLSFEIEMSEAQRSKIAPMIKEAWTMRSDVFAFSAEHDAWNEGRKRMRDLKKKTDSRIKAVLAKDQWKAYEKALKKLQKAVRQEMGGR
jgi:hypothetical protein